MRKGHCGSMVGSAKRRKEAVQERIQGGQGASVPLQKFFKYVTIRYKHHEIMFNDV